ncbi:MAG: lysophospholipid acyltransferase family protein [Planctomycetales bacterium]|nr:lysophospholipid acyltransferase family protein [Planctomycetales bacterium]
MQQHKDGNWVQWLAYLALRCVICAIQSMSLEACDRMCRILATVLADWTTLRRDITDSNLQLVYGNLSRDHLALLRRRMWHNLLLMVCEIAQAPRKIHRTNWRDHIYMPQKRITVKALMDSRATVLVTGHFGNFEVAGHVVGTVGLPPHTMARPLDNPYIDEFLESFRSSGGQKILPKEGSSVAVQELLDQKGTLAILADQHAGKKGCWVDFFGHPTSCHKALALFVLSAGAPMVVNYTRRLNRPLRFEMGTIGIADPALLEQTDPPEYLSSVNELTEWYNAQLESIIRLAPEQYWWLHRRWRDVPPAQLKRLAARRAKKHSAA